MPKDQQSNKLKIKKDSKLKENQNNRLEISNLKKRQNNLIKIMMLIKRRKKKVENDYLNKNKIKYKSILYFEFKMMFVYNLLIIL